MSALSTPERPPDFVVRLTRSFSTMTGAQKIATGAGVAIVAILVVVGIVAPTWGGSSSDGSPVSVGPAARTDSPHDVCTRQLVATIVDVHNNGTSGYENEIAVNGQSDPFLQAATQLSGQFYSDLYASGQAKATANLAAGAARLCDGQLGNQVRQNFPTDGRYPGQNY